MKRDDKMKKKRIIILLLIVVIFLIGCKKNENRNVENILPKAETIEKNNYEKQALDVTVNITTDSDGFVAGFIYKKNS